MRRVVINHTTIFIITALLVFTIACTTKKEEKPVDSNAKKAHDVVVLTAAQRQTADIAVGKIEKKTLSGTLRVNGKLDVPPQNLVSISAPFGGFLKSTEMLQGKPVKKGEVIATMENPEYIQLQQDYLDSKSQLEFLREEYHRQEELATENVNAKKSLQQAKAAYESKEAAVNGLNAKLKMLNVDFSSLGRGEISSTIKLYSPISGFVTEVNFNIGSFVNPTDVLFKIVDATHVHAELTVFEKDIVKIRKGQKVRFTLAGDTKERMATVYLIGREISPDRTVRIHSHLDEEDANLLPGMYLTALIELENNPVDALPDDAVVEYGGRHYVFIAGKNDEFRQVEVRTGMHELGYTEITLPDTVDRATTNIVVRGAYSLLSKLKNTESETGD